MLNILMLDQAYISYTVALKRYLPRFLFGIEPLEVQVGHSKFLVEPRSSDLFTIYEIFYDQGYLPSLPNLPQEMHTVVDFGANIGVFSVWAAHCFHPRRVIAVEMMPGCFQRLRRNIALNALEGTIEAVQGAIFDRSGEVGIRQITGSVFYAIAPQRITHTVPSFSFKDFLCTNQIEQIDFLKIDIEGAEKYLLTAENGDLFRERVRYMVLETHTLNDFRIEQAVAYLSGLGFRLALSRTPFVLDRNFIINAANPACS